MKPERGDCLSVKYNIMVSTIPNGTNIEIPKGALVTIIQALGGNYTISYQGNWCILFAENKDALGIEDDHKVELTDKLLDNIWLILKDCYDPEIPVNIVDLGLIYDVSVHDSTVKINMTLTSPSCGMGNIIVQEIEKKILKYTPIEDVQINLIFDPPWEVSKMSEEARLTLNL